MTATLFRPVADTGLLVEFGVHARPATLAKVRQLDAALRRHGFPGFRESVPAMVNLLVLFDPLVIGHVGAEAHLRGLIRDAAGVSDGRTTRQVDICYEDDLAPDLAAVAAASGLAPAAVIAAHLGGDYAVAMYGFAPGYAYLTGVPAPLHLPRKPAARRAVPAGSVIIAGAQCLVTTLTMPTGWWIIGRSPTAILRDDPARPFLFEVGDKLRFRRIDRTAFESSIRGGT